MAALFSLIFTLVLLAIGFLFFCVPAAAVWLVFDRLALTQLSTIFRRVLPCVLIPLTYVALIVALVLWTTRPAGIFEMAFDFSPTSDVTISSASQSGIGDYGERRLLFTAGESTVNRIVRKQFRTSLEDSSLDQHGNYNFKREYSETFASETSELTYNPETQEVLYKWIGVD